MDDVRKCLDGRASYCNESSEQTENNLLLWLKSRRYKKLVDIKTAGEKLIKPHEERFSEKHPIRELKIQSHRWHRAETKDFIKTWWNKSDSSLDEFIYFTAAFLSEQTVLMSSQVGKAVETSDSWYLEAWEKKVFINLWQNKM